MPTTDVREMTIEVSGKKKKGVSKPYVVALGLAALALLMTTIAFAVMYSEMKTENDALLHVNGTDVRPPVADQVCMRPACLKASSDLMRSINPDVNPCDNFYEFACGNWNLTNPMPETRGRWGVFEVLRKKLLDSLKGLLEAEQSSPVDAVEKMRVYYKSCVDEEAIERVGIIPFAQLFADIFPESIANFPFNNVDNAPTVPQLLGVLRRARRYGLTLGIMTNGVTNSPHNPRINEIVFDVGTLPMDAAYYKPTENGTEKNELVAYREYLVDMFQLFAQKMNRTFTAEQAGVSADRLISFEKFLVEIRLTPQERAQPGILRNEMTIAQFAQNYTEAIGINASQMVRYFEDTWNETAGIDAVISENTIINVRETAYFQNLSSEIVTLENRPDGRRSFALYLSWQIARSYAGRLGADFRNITETFNTKLRGPGTAPPPRWETCVNLVNGEFPNAIGRLYVEGVNFSKETKTKLETMVKYVFEAFREMIKEAEWMTEATKQRALNKTNNFAVLTGYEDYIVDDTARLNQEHAEFKPSNSSYLANVFSMQRLQVTNEGHELLKVSTPYTWISGAAIVNAFYAPWLNSITFPAGILEPPFLGAEYPEYWNFGAIGTVIGHEITHGFDNNGARYDWDGSYGVPGWWDTQSLQEFTRRGDALKAQYSGYSLMGVQMNGDLTIGENIADNGGLKEAFRAYKAFRKATRGDAPEERLPHIDFSPEQLFFLANSQVWCGDYRLRDLESQVRNGAHSPGRFRVIGPLQNYDEFSKAFSCPVGSYMNPQQKNIVW